MRFLRSLYFCVILLAGAFTAPVAMFYVASLLPNPLLGASLGILALCLVTALVVTALED